MIKFTLLMCIYDKENPQHFRQCLESINKLTVRPDEIVIVKDGRLTDELEEVTVGFQFTCDVNIVALPTTMTLGPARAAGVEAARNEWIAIMDCDDICRPDRFEKQLKMIEDTPEPGLVGGQIAEFENVITGHGDVSSVSFRSVPPCRRNSLHETEEASPRPVIDAIRSVPVGHDDIVRFAKMRNPFNHMTVMFKRDAVLEAGNYRLFPLFEDYDLWTRMIKNGTICANHPDVLVDARIGKSTYGRRRGSSYARMEWRMQRQLKKLGMINTFEFLRNMIVRIPVRLLPGGVLAMIYKRFTRGRAG